MAASGPADVQAAEQAFERRIAAIHGLGRRGLLVEEGAGDVVMDTRHAEMLAMVESFLGSDYDGRKVARLLDLQDLLHETQARLLEAYESRQLRPEQYVAAFNDALRRDLEECQRLLGREDFGRLFGCRIDEAQGYIDPETFLAAEAGRLDYQGLSSYRA